jgi:dihydrofolate synthase / folylpolyglutamate synthase
MNLELSEILVTYDRLTNWELADRGAMKVDLEALHDLLISAGSPQKCFRAVHIAGTKGKGSVGALIEIGLNRGGLICGRFSSPHVERVTERITFGGIEISEDSLAAVLKRAWLMREHAFARGRVGSHATRFDLETLAAILAFVEAHVHWAVIECGMGGRFDSTNVIDAEVAVLTNVALEHTAVLGKTHAAIAYQKAGILKPGASMITAVAPKSEAGRVVWQEAHKLGCRVDYCPVEISETLFQSNKRLAQAVLDEIGARGVIAQTANLTPKRVGGWLIDNLAPSQASLPGRMERFNVPWQSYSERPSCHARRSIQVVLDGAHVPFNLQAVLRDLNRMEGLEGHCVVVFAIGRDKQAPELLSVLKQRARMVICTQFSAGPPGYDPRKLCRLAKALQIPALYHPSPRAAFAKACTQATTGEWVFVTGSLHLVGELRPIVRTLASWQNGNQACFGTADSITPGHRFQVMGDHC